MNSAKFFIKPFFVDPAVAASQRVSTGKQLSLTGRYCDLCFSGNMKVREDRNFGISQESMMHISVFCGLPGYFEVLQKSLKGEKSVLKCSEHEKRYLLI